ncbi:TPA: DcaP family trimeric outer membrane transporter [Stenotrophomonas maltophilia]|nr:MULTISPECIES: DcaP family trimeric outer membrane transporter [Stenotrophomonas]MBN5004124.1 porin [Stenotrophomonas maltophilia]MCF3494283.1 porin [Stenotrophomonas maltophilia]MCF3514591.1 porin [Stenotrophomonas maltophilia]MCO7477919.1 DcaP family trimeric outer membrane transporter [Stenotrophomonas maltophilia]
MKPRTLAIAMALALAPGWASAQDSVATLREEITQVQNHLQALTERLNALERGQGTQAQSGTPAPATAPQTAPASSVVTTPPAAAATSIAQLSPSRSAATTQSVLPPRDSVADPSTAASRPDNAPSPTDPELKGFFAIPGTETMIRLGGYAKLDAIADGRAAGDTEQFVTSSIPVGGPHRDVSHFDMHAKQTRFSFEARRPTSHGNLRFYLENDFFGSSDSYQFRLRHAYGQLGNTYAGYGYSTFMDADSLPDTLDFAGPGGAGYLLVAGIHHSFALGKGNSLTIAAEDPDAQLANTGDSDISADRFPDVSLVARMERNWGHLQLGAVARSLGYDGDGRSDRTFGGGLQLSGSFAVAERDLLLFGLLGGKGMGRYTADLTGSGLDAAINADGRLKALPLYGGFFGYTHYWSEMWRSNLIYGELHMDDADALANDAFRRSRYGALNLIWSPAPSWTMGMELLYGQQQLQDGRSADTLRLQGSLQYSFIK